MLKGSIDYLNQKHLEPLGFNPLELLVYCLHTKFTTYNN